MSTRVGHGRICVTYYSIALPRKPRVGRKDLLDISYTSQVIADFVSNLVALATWVGPFKISLTPLDSVIQNPLLNARISEISLIQAEL